MIIREPDHPTMRSAPPGPPSFDDEWSALDPAFQRCLELAWESSCAGSLGIGAVVTAPDGSVVATGRNRLSESSTGDDHLAGSPVAHAELNALGKLPAFVDHSSFTLWTSLEPCLLCAGGVRLARVGTVRFLAGDPLWIGLSEVPSIDPFIGRGWPINDGPSSSAFAAFSMLLPLHAAAFWNPESELVVTWNDHAPAVGELAAALVESHELIALAASSAPVTEVIGELWSRLPSGPPADRPTGDR